MTAPMTSTPVFTTETTDAESVVVEPTVAIEPVTATITAPVVAPVAVALIRRAMPIVATTAGIALATLAAERTLAGFALRAVERTGLSRRPSITSELEVTRVVTTRTTVIERITRHSR